LRLTAPDLVEVGIADEIIPEPIGGAHRDPKGAADILKSALLGAIEELRTIPLQQLVERRQERYASIGVWGTAEDALA